MEVVKMTPVANENIENKFSSLSAEEKVSVISHGVALRLSEWKKRLFLAESKVRFFRETSLEEVMRVIQKKIN
jgi:predicted metallopeptidase